MRDFTEEAKNLLDNATMEVIANYMDDDIREAVHRDMAPCTDEEFLTEYMSRHYEAYKEIFTI